jgi:AcrR family transcriptional regulator
MKSRNNVDDLGVAPGGEAEPASARERILQSATRLFYEEGIRATGIDRVIAQAAVTKVTFYRHFPSKNDLILEYLERRHLRWMAWFREALARHGGPANPAKAVVGALDEWFAGRALAPFRGCAFLNGVGEMGPALSEVFDITRRHKQDMADAVSDLLPPSRDRKAIAAAIAQSIDGAILQVQYTGDAKAASRTLALAITRLCGARAA